MNSLVLIDRIVGEMLTESQFYEAWRKKTAAGAEQGEVCVCGGRRISRNNFSLDQQQEQSGSLLSLTFFDPLIGCSNKVRIGSRPWTS